MMGRGPLLDVDVTGVNAGSRLACSFGRKVAVDDSGVILLHNNATPEAPKPRSSGWAFRPPKKRAKRKTSMGATAANGPLLLAHGTLHHLSPHS